MDDLCACVCEEPSLSPGMKILYACTSGFLVLMAGLVSGLTLGLMSMDEVDLKVLQKSGTEAEKKCAKRIEPVVAHPHLLLVTLLIANAICAEALPIFLDRLMDPVSAILVSVSVVLVFGEILPQAVCSRYGLQVGAYSAWLVRLLIYLFWILAYPISKLLDWLLGHEQTALFRRPQLKALVDVQVEQSALTHQEAHVIAGALDMSTKVVREAMTPISKVFALPDDAILNEDTLQRVLDSGHSRVPVYRAGDRQHLVGLVLVKELILLDPDDNVPLKALKLRSLPYVSADLAMYDILQIFSTGRSHMAALYVKKGMEGIAEDGNEMVGTSTGASFDLSDIAERPASAPLYEPPPLIPPAQSWDTTEAPYLDEASGKGDVVIKVLEGSESAPLLRGISATSDASSLPPPPPPMPQGDACEIKGKEDGISPRSGTVKVGEKSKIKLSAGEDKSLGRGKLDKQATKPKILMKTMTDLIQDDQREEYETVGIITIEDVMEELLQHEILDETDRYVDNMRTMKAVTDTLVNNLPPHLAKLLENRNLYAKINLVQSARSGINHLVLREPLLQKDVVVAMSAPDEQRNHRP